MVNCMPLRQRGSTSTSNDHDGSVFSVGGRCTRARQMSGLRVGVVCVLVVLAGCGGLPFGGSDDGTPTLAEEASTPTAEPTATTTPATVTPGSNTTSGNRTTPGAGNQSGVTGEH